MGGECSQELPQSHGSFSSTCVVTFDKKREKEKKPPFQTGREGQEERYGMR